MLHVLDRFVIHFFSSGGILLCCFFVLHFVQRKKQWIWLPALMQPQLLLVGVCVFAGSALREAYDVHAGQTLVKAIIDYVSWAAGCACSIWGLWRFRSI